MAQEEIRRLTDELLAKEKEQSKLGKLWLQRNISDYVLIIYYILCIIDYYVLYIILYIVLHIICIIIDVFSG